MTADDSTSDPVNLDHRVGAAEDMFRGPRRLAAVVVTGLVAFALSAVWYGAFAEVVARFSKGSVGQPAAWMFAVAPLREILSAAVLAFLIDHVRPRAWKGDLWLGFVLWLGFYFVQLTGAVIFENLPLPLGAVHAGDWLIKLLVMTSALSAWQRRTMRTRLAMRAKP
jgi:hypothetical protein